MKKKKLQKDSKVDAQEAKNVLHDLCASISILAHEVEQIAEYGQNKRLKALVKMRVNQAFDRVDAVKRLYKV